MPWRALRKGKKHKYSEWVSNGLLPRRSEQLDQEGGWIFHEEKVVSLR